MVTYLLLVHLCCAEGGNTANKYHWCVSGVFAVWTTLVSPCSWCVCFSWSMMLKAPGCSAGELSKAGPGFRVLPGPCCSGSRSSVLHKGTNSVGPAFCALSGLSSSGNKVLGEHTVPGWRCVLSTSLAPANKFSGCAVKHLLRHVYRVSPLGN